jgi:dATP pyrophosphohydrolase
MIGGKIKEGEMAWEAGLRELNEETKANPDLYWVIPSVNHFYNHRNDNIELIPAFAAELDCHSEIILNEEHSEFKWIEYKNCNDFIQWPEQRRLLSLTNTLLNSQQILEDWKITL